MVREWLANCEIILMWGLAACEEDVQDMQRCV